MDVVRETSIVNIKNKMTDIRRSRNGKQIYHNYFNNCDNDEEIFVLYGDDSVVFWDDDNGVKRAYFYASDENELVSLIKMIPKGCVIDYVTRKKDKNVMDILALGKCNLLYEMHRMSKAGLTLDEKKAIDEKYKILQQELYRPDKVRCASVKDTDILYEKLYDVFDKRESHLPSREELIKFINNKWVTVFYEGDELKAFQIITVDHGQSYGYQIWNDAGPEGYFSLVVETDKLFAEYLREHKVEQRVAPKQKKPSYCWVNVKNKKAVRIVKFWGNKFDGLYDFVYEKL
ncbi:MAG: hypothetical protein E7198_01875 [Schwartzia succinivorans]|uniref:hypothetical protein n=1 Tax=Schwartzia succinivorans TaxID=55507 RepID=UPI00235621AE|nr:hypothetical protein [Schwartzia succinivorans]MBE6096532.1 hypothetical protein [Schwartzia succinivorans]